MDRSCAKSYNIQIIRGLAIIAVVFIHNTPAGIYQVLCRPFLNFCVAEFLFISGYLSKIEKWNVKGRLNKVIVPYVIWTLIYTFLYNYKNIRIIPSIFLKSLLLGNAAPIMYYIFVYCELTLLIPMIDKLAKSKYKYCGFIISLLEIIIMRLIPSITGYIFNDYIIKIMNLSCLGWFIYFYLGYVSGNNIIKIKFNTYKLCAAYLCSLVLQVMEGFAYLYMGINNYGTQLKLTSVITSVIFCLISYNLINTNKKLNLKILYVLGNYSFGIYFTHMAIMLILEKIPCYSGIIYPFNAIAVIIVSAVVVISVHKILGGKSKYLAF